MLFTCRGRDCSGRLAGRQAGRQTNGASPSLVSALRAMDCSWLEQQMIPLWQSLIESDTLWRGNASVDVGGRRAPIGKCRRVFYGGRRPGHNQTVIGLHSVFVEAVSSAQDFAWREQSPRPADDQYRHHPPSVDRSPTSLVGGLRRSVRLLPSTMGS